MKRKKKIILLALFVAATIGVTKAYAQKTNEPDSVEIHLRSLYTKTRKKRTISRKGLTHTTRLNGLSTTQKITTEMLAHGE